MPAISWNIFHVTNRLVSDMHSDTAECSSVDYLVQTHIHMKTLLNLKAALFFQADWCFNFLFDYLSECAVVLLMKMNF